MDATFEAHPRRTMRAAAPFVALPMVLAVMLACETAPAQAGAGSLLPPRPASLVTLVQSGPMLKVTNVSVLPGTEVPLGISVALNDQSQAGLVMIRGIPADLSLSAGFRSGETWMISVKDVPTVRLVVPDNVAGSFEMDVTLVLGKESRERKAALVKIATSAKSTSDSQPTSAKIANERPAAPTVAPAAAAVAAPPSPEERAMLERAVELLRNGDVSSARLLYQHLANSGSAAAALSLARTYDPEVLPSLGVIGMRANPAEAERWYKRAAELGNDSAAKRLRASSTTNR
jgi:hypothetical protein